MDDFKDTEIFSGKTFGDLCQEIYNNQKKKERQFNSIIQELKSLIEDIGDATLLIPLIKDLMDIGVKNDDALLKLANIISRLQAKSMSTSKSDSMYISDEERKQLLAEINSIVEEK